VSGVCQQASCTDQIKNGTESDIDCGGSCASKCGTNQICGGGGDCISKICTGGKCQAPSCSDKVSNGSESGVDCGGSSSCARCPNGQACTASSDCTTGFCHPTDHVCASPGCGDGILNGTETDKDCGGSCSTKCGTNQACKLAADCVSANCTGTGALTCAAPTCTDKVKNQGETDADCGGPNCPDCADGRTCGANADCVSAVCATGVCQAPTCGDSAKNQDETDLNCGGTKCPICADGKGCLLARDCDSTVCSTTCQANTFAALYKQWGTSATDSEIKPELAIANYSGAAVDSGSVKLRYFYSDEAGGTAVSDCYGPDSAPTNAGCEDRVITFGMQNGLAYMELAFTASAFTIPNNGTSGAFSLHIHRNDWAGNYNETNDFSYDAAHTTVSEHRMIAVYKKNGSTWTRVYGLEP
jgi:hypothetical protein